MGFIVVFAAIKGWKRGFVSELGGAVALLAALVVPFWYNGMFDAALASLWNLAPGSAHIVGIFVTSTATYVGMTLLSWSFNRFARLPVLGFGNALAGALVGILKAGVFLWAMLYVGLLLPLPGDVRGALHHSYLVAVLTKPDGRIDAAISGTLPWFVRPLLNPILNRHRV
jgi:uncharacterized membrane protein required for colicin V production